MPEQTFTLTEDQRDEFERAGALHIPGYFPAAGMAAIADAVWADLKTRFKIERQRRETWPKKAGQARPGQFSHLIRSGAYAPFSSERLFAIGDAFLGKDRWQRPEPGTAMPLITFPTGARWEVPHRTWHHDMSPSNCVGRLPTVRVFTFLEPVAPRGGGTCYVTGTHRLGIEAASRTPGVRTHTQDTLNVLKREHPWFKALCKEGVGDRVQRFMVDGDIVNGVGVKVREMTGEPGDIVLIHPALLHAAHAENERPNPRMMLMAFLGESGPQPEMS